MCDQLWRTHIEGQARVKAEQGSSTKTGEKQAALRRELHAQIAAQAHFHSLPGRLARLIYFEDSRLSEKSDASKFASFGPLCLSSDSPRCPLSKSLMVFKIRRVVGPYFKLPSGTLYFRHYEVGCAVPVCVCMENCSCYKAGGASATRVATRATTSAPTTTTRASGRLYQA